MASARSRGSSAAASEWNARSAYAPCSNTRRTTANAHARADPAGPAPRPAGGPRRRLAPVATKELLAAHGPPARGLHHQQLEASLAAAEDWSGPIESDDTRLRSAVVEDPHLPDAEGGSVRQPHVSADVRRQRPHHAGQLAGGSRRVELPIGRPERLRVSHAPRALVLA